MQDSWAGACKIAEYPHASSRRNIISINIFAGHKYVRGGGEVDLRARDAARMSERA
jgi:hypothetical protein